MTFWKGLRDIPKFHRGLLRVDRSYYNEIVDTFEINSVLDVGCGFGDTQKAIRRDLYYAGIDQTRQFLIRSTSDNLIEAKAEALPFPNRSFEMVTCRALLEHILNPDPVLAEMGRIALELIVIVWFIEPGREKIRYDKKGFYNNRHDPDRIFRGLPGWNLILNYPVGRHIVWVFQ